MDDREITAVVSVSEGDAVSEEEMEAALELARQLEMQRQEVFSRLAQMVDKEFTERKTYRNTKEAQWITAESLYLGRLGGNRNETKNPFTHDNQTEIPPDFNIVQTKVDNTVAALEASQFATGDKNWDLKPSPTAELCPEDAQLAAQSAQEKAQGAPVTEALYQSEVQRISSEKCRAMEAEIEDQLTQCAYGSEARKAMEDLVKLGTAVMKGPTNSARLKKTYEIQYASDGSRVYIPRLSFEPRPGTWRVDPWLFFPDTTTNDPNKLKDAIEVHPYTRSNLQDLRSNEGFFVDQIDEVLKEKPKDWVSVFNDIRGAASLTIGTERLFKDKYLILEYHGPIKKADLDASGVEYACTCGEDDETVFGEVWVCNGKVIRFAVHALDGQNEVPYAIDVYKKDPGSVFGFGLPDILEGQQRVINKLYYLALWNSGMSCAPIQVINKAILSPAGRGQGYDVAPGKTYLANENSFDYDLSRAITFIDIPNSTAELVSLMDYVRALAEESSNMPAIMAGMTTPQGQESATGVAIANQNATAPLFHQSQQWDDTITRKVIRWMYDWNMQFNPTDWIKGDYEIDVITSTQLINRQQAKLDAQNLLMMAGQNPEIALHVNTPEVIRGVLSMMKIPFSEWVKTPEQVEAIQQQMAQNQQPDPNLLKAQADMMQAENQRKKMEIEEQRLQFQTQQEQQREYWDHLEKMEQYKTRQLELQADLVEKEYDHAIKQLDLAIRDENQKADAIVKAQQSLLNAQTMKAKIGADMQLKATDQALHAQEMQLRRETGAGV